MNTKPVHVGRSALRLVKLWQGAHATGQIYQLTNTSSKTVYLTEQQFLLPNVLAVGLQQKIIVPAGHTWVYEVVNHG